MFSQSWRGRSTALVLFAGTALAHECYNPNKPDGAGVNYTLTGFDTNGAPIFTQTGPGQGIGGFVDAFGTDVHSAGQQWRYAGSSATPTRCPRSSLCDGQGIDFLGCP